jgi:hypothetical protein
LLDVVHYGLLWKLERTLLVADQMLWFGTQLCNSLLNPNQLHAFGVDVNDNPFDLNEDLSLQCDEAFIPCVKRGMIVHFEMCVHTNGELKHLPIYIGMETAKNTI